MEARLAKHDAKQKFKNIKSCFFDKGFHSPSNQKKLSVLLDKMILPFKGKLSEKRKAIEYSEEFLEARRQHSAKDMSVWVCWQEIFRLLDMQFNKRN